MLNFLTPFLLISLFSSAQSLTNQESINQPQIIKDWKKFDQSNYSIQYPPSWDLNISGQMGTSFILFSPLENEDDKFMENINLLAQDLSGLNIDLDKYTEISEGQIKTMVTNSSIQESRRMKINRSEYHKIIYSGEQGIYQLKFIQYYMVINDKAYVLTFTSEENKFEDYIEIAEKILNSFTFI